MDDMTAAQRAIEARLERLEHLPPAEQAAELAALQEAVARLTQMSAWGSYQRARLMLLGHIRRYGAEHPETQAAREAFRRHVAMLRQMPELKGVAWLPASGEER